jgi:hypothetical protein
MLIIEGRIRPAFKFGTVRWEKHSSASRRMPAMRQTILADTLPA